MKIGTLVFAAIVGTALNFSALQARDTATDGSSPTLSSATASTTPLNSKS